MAIKSGTRMILWGWFFIYSIVPYKETFPCTPSLFINRHLSESHKLDLPIKTIRLLENIAIDKNWLSIFIENQAWESEDLTYIFILNYLHLSPH